MANADFVTGRPIAHRGLHDGNLAVWENTLSAFRKAIEGGYAIECDLQYAADAVPVVFHDDDMKRLCNVAVDVREKTSGELGLMSVGGTQDKVPTLKKLLELVSGRVPLVLELKGREGDDEGFASSVLEVLEGYGGEVALMSFDVWLLRDLKELDCPYPVGLTAEGTTPEEFANHEKAMSYGLEFISYNIDHMPNGFLDSQETRGVKLVSWTVTTQEMAEKSWKLGAQITFERFIPDKAG